MKNIKKSQNKINKILAYVTIFVILLGVPMACIIYVYSLRQDKTILEWRPNVTDDEKIKRTSDRGTIISISLMVSSVIQATLKYTGASSTMLLLLYGFFMANVLGFMGDQGYGTDEGYSLKEIGKTVEGKVIDGIGAQLKYIFGSLNTNSFWRFIITVFLDMFISAPIQSVIIAVFNPHIQNLKNTIPLLPKIIGWLLKIVIKNIDNVLQSFVAFITFLAYANDTRFRWAYPGSDINPNLLISTSVIKISTAIAGLVYLIANISADFNIIDGATMKIGTSLVDRLDRKMWFILILIGLLTIGSLNKNSFLNKKNNKYDIKPLVNMTDDSVWHYDTALNYFYREEMEKILNADQRKEICKEKTNYWQTCEVDPKTGNLVLDSNDVKNNPLKDIINENKKTIESYNIEIDVNGDPVIDPKTKTFKRINTIGTVNPNTRTKELSQYIEDKNWDNNKPCFIPDYAFLCNCEDYDQVTFNNKNGQNMIYNDFNSPEYKKKFCSYKDKDINNKNFESDVFKEEKEKLQKELDKADNEYKKAEKKYKRALKREDFKQTKTNINDLKIKRDNAKSKIDDAKNKYERYINRSQLNENNGRLVKKIDMGLYRTDNTNIEDKYDIMDKSKSGFGIFCLYILIGVVLPFIPLKFIYGDELKEKGRLWKLVLVSSVVYGISGILYFISTKSPTNNDLQKAESSLLSN
jgi:hypothetical protein